MATGECPTCGLCRECVDEQTRLMAAQLNADVTAVHRAATDVFDDPDDAVSFIEAFTVYRLEEWGAVIGMQNMTGSEVAEEIERELLR